MNKSHITQELLNYFDATDTRVRKSPYTIDAQLLNLPASALENLELRLRRESKRSLVNVPTNIDNRGVYYSLRLPISFDLASDATTLNSVIGYRGATPFTLLPFDDLLPIPAKLIAGTPIALSNPLLFTMVGSGDTRDKVYEIKTAAPGDLPVPNRVTFWLDELQYHDVHLDVHIQGQLYPLPAWERQRAPQAEVIQVTQGGAFTSRHRWASIDKVTVRGLPAGAKLRAWSLPFNLPAVLDSDRPYIDPDYRDVVFSRYWQIDNSQGLLKEMFMGPVFSDLQYVQSYRTPENLIDIAVEPETHGLWAASNNLLYYCDRREPMPVKLLGLSQSPSCGLLVSYDPTKPGYTRTVTLTPDPYQGADTIIRYRYYMMTPSGVLQVITPEGALAPYSSGAGWRPGQPEELSVPLTEEGEYSFTLECMTPESGVTLDSTPYVNLAMIPLTQLSTGSFSAIKGVCFDSFGQLWIWTGSFAIPVTVEYQAYVLDAPNRRLFVTALFDRVEVA